MNVKTYSQKPSEVTRRWILIDASEAPVGRVATVIAKYLIGKYKPTYTPHIDGGDYVVWKKGLGKKYTAGDYDTWRAHYGETYPNGSGATLGAVPEPEAWILLGVGAAWMFAGMRNVHRVYDGTSVSF